MTKKLEEIPYLATRRARKIGGEVIIEEASDESMPRAKVIVLDRGRIIFTGTWREFERSNLNEVVRLTYADNGTVISDFVTGDPWDKRRRPHEPIL